MSPFQNSDNPAIIPAINKNMLEIFKILSSSPKSEIRSSEELIWSITDIPFPLFNFVLYSSFKTGGAEKAIENVVTECRSRKVPVMWRLDPKTQPDNLGTLLEMHGFQLSEIIPGMAIDIQKNIHPPTQNGFEIKRVSDEQILTDYLKVVKEVVGMPDFAVKELHDFCVFLGFEENLPMQRFLGYLNDEPVATSMFVLGAGVVGIYDVTTLSKARKKGIGSTMTFHALECAYNLGYNIGVLTSSEEAYNMYKKLGFREICKIPHYSWDPSVSE